jgi:molecular chaperone GrpE
MTKRMSRRGIVYRLHRQRLHPDRPRGEQKKRKPVPAPPTDQEIRAKLARYVEEYKNLKDQYLRVNSEFENYRKRTRREQEALRDQVIGSFVGELVPVLDSLEQALTAAQSTNDLMALAQGVMAINAQFERILSDKGVLRIEPKGHTFDPNLHEALGVVKTKEHPNNTVIDVLQNGYSINGRLIRPARVRIAQGG